MKRKFSYRLLPALVLGVFLVNQVVVVESVQAAAVGSVVINEVAWAGTSDNSNDEWVELYNAGSLAVNLEGWKLKDDGVVVYTFGPITIPPKGYLLLEDQENAVANVNADIIYNLSLANTGDSLELVDNTGTRVDIVNASGGTWYAGSTSEAATMEKKDPLAGDVAGNFANSTGGSGALGANGSAIKGTPKTLNSVSAVPAGPKIMLSELSSGNYQAGQEITLEIKAESLSEVFSYGISLDYDAAVLELVSAAKGSFLSQDGQVETSFQSGLENGEAGKLMLAEARTVANKSAVSGGGILAVVKFKILNPLDTNIIFAGNSFVSGLSGDLAAYWAPTLVPLAPQQAAPLNFSGLSASEGAARYQIQLNWQGDADQYIVERKKTDGEFAMIATVNETGFLDQDSVAGAGKIIPKLNYYYRVKAVKAGQESDYLVIEAADGRGLKGDNNRSDMVDGRDLENLAKHFAEQQGDAGFEPLIDSNFDGRVDGSDLIDLGANFAKKYQ